MTEKSWRMQNISSFSQESCRWFPFHIFYVDQVEAEKKGIVQYSFTSVDLYVRDDASV